jgi:RNA polymerase sigma factor (sigma-70 family)
MLPTFISPDRPPDLPSCCPLSADLTRIGLRQARAIARRRAGYGARAEDLQAEAALALVECSWRFRTECGGGVTSYAWPRMVGKALDALRREGRAERVARALAAEPGTSITPPAAVSTRVDLERALDRADLQPTEEMVLREVYWEGRSLADVAMRSGRDPQQLGRRHRAAVERLRRILAAD